MTANAATDSTGSGSQEVISQGNYTETYTINPVDSAFIGTPGVARFSFTLSGFATNQDNLGWVWGGGVTGSPHGDSTANEPYGGTGTQPQVGFFTVDESFTFGSPFAVSASASAEIDTFGPNVAGTVYVSLQSQGYHVFGGGNPVEFTGTSTTGVSVGKNVSSGSSFSGITLTNTSALGHGTTASVIGGTATADRNVGLAMTVPTGSGKVIGDSVNLSGFGSTSGQPTDTFVLQMSFDPSAALAAYGDLTGMRLMWFDTSLGDWTLATDGNFGGTPMFFAGAYDPAVDNHLGYYGVDLATDTVWAVLNHNSEFAVGWVVPEPSSWVPLLGGLGMLLGFQRWKKPATKKV